MQISTRALLVVRKGRKRKSGKRFPCGQLVDGTKIDPKVIAFLQPHRRDVKPELRHDAKAESVLGRLELGGKITKEQYGAGEWYAGVVRRYRQVIMAPNPTPGSIAGAQIIGGGGPSHIEDEEAIRRKSAYDSAFELLDGIGQRVAKAVAHVAVHNREIDREALKLLVIGLEALAIHRGLTKPKNSCTEIENRALLRQ